MTNIKIITTLLITLLSITSVNLFAHSGGLDAMGGHTNRTTGIYHCHSAVCASGEGQMTESEPPVGSSPHCDYPSQLEVTVINIGQGDATLIASPTRLLLADSGESSWNSNADALKIEEVISEKYGDQCRTIDYYINSHFHLDHIGYIQANYNEQRQLLNSTGGIWSPGDSLQNPRFLGGIAHLVNGLGFEVRQSLFRDYIAHNPNRLPSANGSKTYWNWRAYLQSAEGIAALHPQTAQLGRQQITMGNVSNTPITIDIIQVDAATTSNPNGCDPATYFGDAANTARGDTTGRTLSASENDLSVAFILTYGNFNMFIGGDTSGHNDSSSFGYSYHDTETCIAEDTSIVTSYGGTLDILRVNHHGSSHSTNDVFLDMFDPTVAIVSVGDRNRHNHVQDSVIESLLRKSTIENNGAVYLTEAGIEDNNWDDFCITRFFTEYCAIIGDNEFESEREANELEDESITIRVDRNGNGYFVFGATEESRQHFETH